MKFLYNAIEIGYKLLNFLMLELRIEHVFNLFLKNGINWIKLKLAFFLTNVFFLASISLNSQQWYSQVNPSWGPHLMNNSCTIRDKGCVITDISMYFNGNWNPGQINSYLNTNCGYSGCSFIWAANIPAGLNYNNLFQISNSNYLSQIAYQLNTGKKVILEFTKPNGGTHWVSVVSVNGNQSYPTSFTVYDPGLPSNANRTLGHSSYSSWFPTRIATFSVGSTACLDVLEPNGSFSQAGSIANGYNINAVLCGNSDVDFYKFMISSTQPKFKVTLSNLPSNYQLEIYKQNSNGSISFVGSSANGCRLNEVVICNQFSTSGFYYAKVFGINQFAFHNQKQYAIKVTTSATPLSLDETNLELRSYTEDEVANVIIVPDELNIKIIPNPISSFNPFKIIISHNIDEKSALEIVNLSGSVIDKRVIDLIVGDIEIQIDNHGLNSGIYFVRLHTASGLIRTGKIIVIK